MDRLYVSVAEACRLVGLGRTTMYELIGAGRIESITIGRRRLINSASLQSLGGVGSEKGN